MKPLQCLMTLNKKEIGAAVVSFDEVCEDLLDEIINHTWKGTVDVASEDPVESVGEKRK